VRTLLVSASRGLALILGVAVALSAQAADKSKVKLAFDPGPGGDAHRMEIQNGSVRTVHYFTPNASPSERLALRELERAENESSYLDDLQMLRQQYVSGEKLLEARRNLVQTAMYGSSSQSTSNSYFVGGYGGVGAYPYSGWYGGAYGAGYGGFGGYGLAGSTTVNNNISEGIGPEGALKEALAPVIARQATGEYTAEVAHANQVALERVGALVKDSANPNRSVATEPVVTARPGPVSLVLKNGDKIDGTLLRETPQWVILRDREDEIRIAVGEIARMSTKAPK